MPAIIGATLFTWSHTTRHRRRIAAVVPVDLVTIGAEDQYRADRADAQPKTPPKEEAQPPRARACPASAGHSRQREAAPTPDAARPAPNPCRKSRNRRSSQKLKPAAATAKKDKFDINSIVALLNKRAPAAASAPNAKVGQSHDQRRRRAERDDRRSQVACSRSMIAQCWSPPVGAPHPEQLVVRFELFLNPDGSGRTAATIGCKLGAPLRAIHTCARGRGGAARDLHMRAVQVAGRPICSNGATSRSTSIRADMVGQ